MPGEIVRMRKTLVGPGASERKSLGIHVRTIAVENTEGFSQSLFEDGTSAQEPK
ncbi:hypothetical protein M413DRAFT_372310 [Hebeloma cylindrosporum]|uniref:Uncharacterized protein n=1 Tax=Hebeloma cylindrosporum TaxID=76867 RepID=A0A0C2Y281_HEBCY|nr:hypothetical protein M413DRAFT_372310 [Hebeloma cylindrosporum h7]